jgi:2-dehydro-3-deoxyphosphooctonate aldolase (KDO 8-P synthase)
VTTDVDPLFRPSPPFFLVAGPCVLEDPELELRVARHLREVAGRLGVPVLFKASFDKANRTSLSSCRGPGLEEGLERLRRVRDETGLPVLTDVHEPHQARAAADAVDVLQVPAFLSRQTDLLLAAGETGRPVNVKKGQWMAPEQIRHSVEKVRAGGSEGVSVTERGTAFGYGRWVVDMRSFRIMRESCRAPALFDATHSVQLPGAGPGESGGEPRHAPALARAAVAAGADALYLETHPAPATAPSDGANMLPLEELEPLMESVLRHVEARDDAARPRRPEKAR